LGHTKKPFDFLGLASKHKERSHHVVKKRKNRKERDDEKKRKDLEDEEKRKD